MKNSIGTSVILTVFGESHGPAVGVLLDGLAPGEYIMKLSLNSAKPRGGSNYYDTIQEVSRFIIVDDPAKNAGFMWTESVWGNFRLKPLEFID